MVEILNPVGCHVSPRGGPVSVARITLNGRSEDNFLSAEARRQAVRDLAHVRSNASVAAVVLAGPSGRAFCSGGDPTEARGIRSAADVDAWLDSIVGLYRAVLECGKPVIAAISGRAYGQGLQLALLSDMRIADYRASFCEPELIEGMGCAIGATVIREVASGSVMTELVYGCREIGALSALERNLVNHVVKHEELAQTAMHWANRLASYDPVAFEYTKATMSKRMIDELERCMPIARDMHKRLMLRR